MDRLPSDLLLKIAELHSKPARTACRLRLLNRQTSATLTPLRITAFVAKVLQRKYATQPRQVEIIKLVLEECGRKMEVLRDAEEKGVKLAAGFASMPLEQHILRKVRQEANGPPRLAMRMPIMRTPKKTTIDSDDDVDDSDVQMAPKPTRRVEIKVRKGPVLVPAVPAAPAPKGGAPAKAGAKVTPKAVAK